MKANTWIIARDHKTDLNSPREYRTAAGLWSTNSLEAYRFTARERNAEMIWLKGALSTNWVIFFYKD